MNCVCYQCKDRQLGCHSKCEKYKEYKETRDKEREYLKSLQNYPLTIPEAQVLEIRTGLIHTSRRYRSQR